MFVLISGANVVGIVGGWCLVVRHFAGVAGSDDDGVVLPIPSGRTPSSLAHRVLIMVFRCIINTFIPPVSGINW